MGLRVLLLLVLTVLAAFSASAQETFRVWHYETSALAASWNQALESFRRAHPGVVVEVTVKSFDEVNATADRILASDQVPDVMEFNKGNANAGYWSTKGAFRPLNAEARTLGWDKVLSPALQTTARYDDRGRMGTGTWYGLSPYGEFVLVYYNKTLLKKAGVKVPSTLGEFEAALSLVKASGAIPLALGAANYPAQHLLYELYLARATRKDVDDFQFYRAPVDFHGPAWKAAAETFQAWGSAGYYSPAALGQDDEAMLAEFQAGEAAFLVGGSWFHPRLAGSDLDWGTMLFPGNRLHPGSGGNLWVVPLRSRHPDWAVEFIDLTLGRGIQTTLANAGGLAVNADPAKITNPRTADLTRYFGQVMTRDGLAFYPDWPALGFYDSLVSACRDLLRGVPVDRVLEGLDVAYRTKKGRF